jgi:pyruvate dehydrogenase E2 component (dihydrolipoamide acetyltransferase)
MRGCIIRYFPLGRAQMNALGDGEYKLSVNDFVIKASALALRDVPEVNASWMGDFIRQYHTVDINIAVSSDAGLVTPLIGGVDALGLEGINAEVKELATKGRDGKLQPQEMAPGGFTISNLGMFGAFLSSVSHPAAALIQRTPHTTAIQIS